ncbi:MAG: isoprenylcysteine carboxylmethyltransferase family protein [Deltaproteobacteria bacterium]|nr:isoprenylcysteine carboxylmethyltransferase family protein [Deltaproteobacteria bacterium]
MFGFIYSLVAYVAFLVAFAGLVFFTDGVLLPKTVDTGVAGQFGVALAINIGLILAWGVQHSVMARQSFKDRLTRILPEHLERSTYVLASSLTLAGLMLLWQPMEGVLWHVESQPLVITLWVVNGLAWAGVPLVSFMIDHFDLFGLKQAFTQWRRRSFERTGFVMPWLYRYVRHPMMTAILLALWVTPHMTVSHLVLALGMSVYIYVGVYFEERSLARELGQAYVDYRAKTPKFLPGLPGAGAGPEEHVATT